MRRGRIVTAAAPGDCGKPKPAVIIQAVVLSEAAQSTIVALVTGPLVDAPLRAARVRANKRGISLGELVLEVLEQRLADDLSDRARDPLFLDDATFSDSWADDLAERHDADLYDEPAA